jgi:hypothetical protein
MTTAIEAQKQTMTPETLLKLATGDTSTLSPTEKMQLIVQVCDIAGLDARLAPFEFIKFQGREILYAKKNAADQLVSVHGIKLSITQQTTENGIRIVTVRAETKDGRATEDIGAVNIDGLTKDSLANAMMKAVTKAKRRTVLSVCGLSMLDESELETIHGPKVVTPVARLVEAAEAVQASLPSDDFEKEYGPEPKDEAVEKVTLAKIARVKALMAHHKDFKTFMYEVLGREVAKASDLSLGDIALLEEADAKQDG